MATKQDKLRLIAAARKLAGQLKLTNHGKLMRIRMPSRPSQPETDGWRIVLGDLGKNQPRLELWLDRFSGYPEPKFNACLFSEDRAKLIKIVRRVSRRFQPIRIFTTQHTDTRKFFELTSRISRSELAKPILEKYEGETFFGIYDASTDISEVATARFLKQAAAFFTEVVESLPQAKGRDIERKDYPCCENRIWVNAHLRRERNRRLAAQRKERDNYRCKVCGMSFAESYGESIGFGFAEAHHIVPLGKLSDKTQTSIEDLITVCANCHRMLHRMAGQPEDIKTLRAMYLKRRKARA